MPITTIVIDEVQVPTAAPDPGQNRGHRARVGHPTAGLHDHPQLSRAVLGSPTCWPHNAENALASAANATTDGDAPTPEQPDQPGDQ